MSNITYTKVYQDILQALKQDYQNVDKDFVQEAKLVTNALWQIHLSTNEPSNENNHFSNTKSVISNIIKNIE
jgi:hypothetical protein